MPSSTFSFKDPNGADIFVYKWTPESSPKGVLQITHGLAEHAARYDEFARFMTNAGFVVYANDIQGHGKTAGSQEKLGILGPGGWKNVVLTLKSLTDYIKSEYPALPFFFLGHSWGALLGQDYISRWGSGLKGAILTGFNGKQPLYVRKLGPLLAKNEIKKNGENTPSPTLDKLTFGAFNKPYMPAPTKFEWLNRDHAEVEKYINDPYCGFMSTAGMALELANGVNHILEKAVLKAVPKSLPVYILSGGKDSSNNFGKGATALGEIYKKMGITDIHLKIYPEARHEILHELNKTDVFADILTWIQAHMK